MLIILTRKKLYQPTVQRLLERELLLPIEALSNRLLLTLDLSIQVIDQAIEIGPEQRPEPLDPARVLFGPAKVALQLPIVFKDLHTLWG